MTCVTPGHNAPIHTRSDSDSGRVLDRPSSTAGEVAGHCGLLATSRMTPSARRVAGGRSLEASGLGRVSGIMPRVYVHVRPHERLNLTSHLTGSRRGQSRAAVASTFTIWVANAQAELVAGTTITTVDPEAAASVGSDLGVTQFTADDPPCRATSRRRQAVFRAATGGGSFVAVAPGAVVSLDGCLTVGGRRPGVVDEQLICSCVVIFASGGRLGSLPCRWYVVLVPSLGGCYAEAR